MKLLLCLALLLLAFAARADRWHPYVMPYYEQIRYGDSAFKDHAQVAGCYLAVGDGMTQLVEVDAERMELTRIRLPLYHQWDTTVAYTRYPSAAWRVRLGGHYIDADDPATDTGRTAFLGATYTRGAGEVGCDAYLSDYPRARPALTILQTSPHVGVTLTRGRAIWHAVLTAHAIRTEEMPGFRAGTRLSGEGALTLDAAGWTLHGSAWAGRQLFAVRNDGFTVYNVAEEHLAGAVASVSRTVRGATVTLQLQHERWHDALRDDVAYSTSLLGLVGVGW